jgi:hypothetical protein
MDPTLTVRAGHRGHERAIDGPHACGESGFAVLIPAPMPAFTLAPGVDLDFDDHVALRDALAVLTGRVAAVLVTGVRRSGPSWLVELHTPLGRLIVIDPPPARSARPELARRCPRERAER